MREIFLVRGEFRTVGLSCTRSLLYARHKHKCLSGLSCPVHVCVCVVGAHQYIINILYSTRKFQWQNSCRMAIRNGKMSCRYMWADSESKTQNGIERVCVR